MAIYVANDLHGNSKLIQKTVDAIRGMNERDVLIINGDGAGARGPIMNNLVRIFYEVRRGETDYEELISALTDIIGEKPEIPKSWVFETVHAGVFRAVMSKYYDAFKKCVEDELLDIIEETIRPIAEAAKEVGVKILYVPGNGEIVPSDFATDDITVEKTLPPEKRFYQRIAREGYFKKFGIEYVPYVYTLTDQIVLISTNLLDLPPSEALNILSKCCQLDDRRPKRIVVHYPPTISPVGKWFDFWTPNKVDIARIDALQRILEALRLKYATVYFGHIHLPASDHRMDALPSVIGFGYDRPDYDGLWVKPGTVLRI